MKKLILLIGCIFLSNLSAFALSNDLASASKASDKIQKNALEVSADEEVTPSQQAMFYYNNNEEKKALDVLLTIPETSRSAQDWFLLGNILQDENKVSDAIFMYQRAITVDPKFYKPYYNLGNIYLEDDKPVMAIQNYRKANKLKNNFPYAYYNLGCAYLETGELKKAKIAFLKAIELKNIEPSFHYNLAYTYKKLGKEKLSRQYLGFYNKLIEANLP